MKKRSSLRQKGERFLYAEQGNHETAGVRQTKKVIRIVRALIFIQALLANSIAFPGFPLYK